MATSLFNDPEIRHRYETIAADPKYRHFVRIPRRILRCLDYFGIHCDRVAAERRLHSYYLFIGVIDNAIDSGQVDAGPVVLRRFETRETCFDRDVSDVSLLTEVLKSEVAGEIYPEMLSTLRELYREVVSEQSAISMTAYICARKSVGRLTAKASYLLIRPLLNKEPGPACEFMERVGEIGCLVDSVIDLRADRHVGLLNFKPTTSDFMRLLNCTARSGVRLSLEHPRLVGLFFQALGDNALDRLRARPNLKTQTVPTDATVSAAWIVR